MKQTKRVLSVVLALAMVLAMGIMVYAADPVTIETKAEKSEDGTLYTVGVYAKTAGDVSQFMAGIAYDSEKFEPVSVGKDADDNELYATFAGPAAGLTSSSGIVSDQYVSFGGIGASTTLADAGALLATVQFKVKAGANVDDAEFAVVQDPAEDFSLENKPEGAQTLPVKEIPVKKPEPAPSAETPASAETPVSAEPAPSAVTPNGGNGGNGNNGGNGGTTPTTSTAPTGTSTPVKAAKTADTANVVIPVVAIVAAAAAVVVVSKKRVEE